MRALLVEELLADFGGCRLADGLAKPAPRAGEVQVKILAAALGFPDLLMARLTCACSGKLWLTK